MIHREATIKYVGYDPDNLKFKSNKRICCVCDECGRVRWLRKADYRDLCQKCSVSNKNNGMFGKHHSDETKYKMKERAIDRYKIPDNHPCFGRIVSEESRKKNSESNKQYYINHPEARDLRRKLILDRKPRFFDTSIELKMQKILTDCGYKYITHQSCCNICLPDLMIPEKKIAIFCDGDYWHNLPNYVKRDKNQDKVLLENGWIPLRFWEHEINENIDDCLYRFELEYWGGEC